jgi:hypothetical protein
MWSQVKGQIIPRELVSMMKGKMASQRHNTPAKFMGYVLTSLYRSIAVYHPECLATFDKLFTNTLTQTYECPTCNFSGSFSFTKRAFSLN